MHLRRLIVLITYIRNIISRSRSCTLTCLRRRIGFLGTKLRLVPHRTEVRCMSEKKPKITSLFYSSPRVSGQTGQKAISLRCQNIRPGNAIAFSQAKLCSHLHVVDHCAGAGNHRALPKRRMVEPDGIEPTTSCLQSRRSPS